MVSITPPNLHEINMMLIINTDQHGNWFAESVDFDYMAAGTSYKDVINRFAIGFALTIKLNLETYGSLKNLQR